MVTTCLVTTYLNQAKPRKNKRIYEGFKNKRSKSIGHDLFGSSRKDEGFGSRDRQSEIAHEGEEQSLQGIENCRIGISGIYLKGFSRDSKRGHYSFSKIQLTRTKKNVIISVIQT